MWRLCNPPGIPLVYTVIHTATIGVTCKQTFTSATLMPSLKCSAQFFKGHSHYVIFSECDCVFSTSHGMDCMDVSDTVYLRFDLKMQSHSG